MQTQLVLFKDIKHSCKLHDAPSVGTATCKIEPQKFANSLKAIYASDDGGIHWSPLEVARVRAFDMPELRRGLRKIAANKCGDEHGIVAEMLKSGSAKLHDTILHSFNEMLSTASFPDDWHHTIFKMLPKTGDSSNVDNWRPIAILPILYKLFNRLLFERIFPILDEHQDTSQLGFRPGMRLENAFATIEGLLSNCHEHHTDLWIASLDMRKAFDRVEFSALFRALRMYGLDEPHLNLIACLYANQHASVDGSSAFRTQRGAK